MSRGNKNITAWADIEEMSFMSGSFDDIHNVKVYKDAAWKWLEMIQKDGKIRAIDIIRISALVENAYYAGLKIGKEMEKDQNESKIV
jgi:hypothetical protein